VARLIFRFDGRPSPARSWDIRFRVAAVGALSTCVLAAPSWTLLPLGAATLVLLALARTSAGEVAAVVRGFIGFLVFFLAVGVAFEPTWTQTGFLAIQAARLLLLLLTGHFLFTAATPSDVTEGIRWYLGWLGRRRAWAAASMAGWALASVPLILDQAGQVLDAAALRGFRPSRHPLRAVGLLTLGLLIRVFERSAQLAASLEARNFGAAVPPSALRARWTDFAALFGLAAWCAASWLVCATVAP
jgi:energy-coupling factor transporter transmembrane protein EcfT